MKNAAPLLPAVFASMTKVDLKLVVYDFDKRQGVFTPIIEVN